MTAALGDGGVDGKLTKRRGGENLDLFGARGLYADAYERRGRRITVLGQAQVLAAKDLLHATASKIILAAAVIDDVLGLLVLAVVSGLTRGDLVFWPGHLGIMLDAVRLLHANTHHMAVAIEPLQGAATRIAQTRAVITAVPGTASAWT